MTQKIFLAGLAVLAFLTSEAQKKAKPEDTEFYTPVPKVVSPGRICGDAPSDAVILFDGKSLDSWVSASDTNKTAGWTLVNGLMRVDKKAGDIQTKQSIIRIFLLI